MHFGLAGGKAAAVTSTPWLPGLAASAAEPPLIARGGARFWRVNFALFFGWVDAADGWPGVAAFVGALSILALGVAMKLMRVPPPAHLRAG